jgi:hypothetical protein
VFAARYELNSYIVFRKRLVPKRLIKDPGWLQLCRLLEVQCYIEHCYTSRNVKGNRKGTIGQIFFKFGASVMPLGIALVSVDFSLLQVVIV